MPKSKGKIPRITVPPIQPFNLSDENWGKVEDSYGQSISQEIRTQINAAIARFVQFAVAEDSGLTINDAVKRITRLRERALSFIDAIKEHPVEDAIRMWVDEELELFYEQSNYDHQLLVRNYVGQLSLELGRFVNVCNEMLDYTSRYNNWPDGGAWETWIRQLTDMLELRRMPTGVRKDTAKLKEDKFSVFAKFIYTLQKFLPSKYTRAQHSLVAIATAIINARQESKPPVARKKSARAKKPRREK